MQRVAQEHLPSSLLSSTIPRASVSCPPPPVPKPGWGGALTCVENANSSCCGNNKCGFFYLTLTLGKSTDPKGCGSGGGLLEGWLKLVLGAKVF